MKKLIATGLAAAFAIGMTTISMAKPVSEMDLDISGLAQFNYNWSEINLNNDELDTARLRLNFAAQPAEHVSIYAEIEGTNNTSLGAWGDNYTRFSGLAAPGGTDGVADSRIVDMYTDLTYIPEVSARIGQFALPISYELNTDEYDLETINYSMGVGVFGIRDRGIMLFGQPIPEFGWAVFGMNGNGAITGATNDGDDQSNYGLKLDWNPLENLNFKAWGMFAEETAASAEIDAFGLGFNYTYLGFRLMGEYNDASADVAAVETDITEWLIHASYVIPETDLQLVLRYDKLDEDTANVNMTDVHITTAGFNWDFEKNATVQLMHEFVGGTGVGENDRTDLMLGIRF
jgi:hypothetical protein